MSESIIAFLEADGYESAIRNAISLGGDADTMACIAGGIAEACYGMPADIEEGVIQRLDPRLCAVTTTFVNTDLRCPIFTDSRCPLFIRLRSRFDRFRMTPPFCSWRMIAPCSVSPLCAFP